MEDFRNITNFNSHARVGRDQLGNKMLPTIENFNSHARVGRDNSQQIANAFGVKFQLTRPRGARLLTYPALERLANFNSHARVGRDLISAKRQM